MSAVLSESSNVGALSFDPVSNLLAVANGASIDLFRGGASTKTLTPGIGTIVKLSMYNSHIVAASATTTVWIKALNGDQTTFENVDALADAKVLSVNENSNPDWVAQVSGAYQFEAVPSGSYVGEYTDATAAVAGGAIVGDFYKATEKARWFEITSTGPAADVEIFRAGSANFPKNFAIFAYPDKVIVSDTGSGTPVMWKVVQNGVGNAIGTNNKTAVSMTDAVLHISSDGSSGLYRLNFATDEAIATDQNQQFIYNGNLAQINDGLGYTAIGGDPIVSPNVNDVASKVLTQVDTTNLLDATEDLTDAFWTKLNSTATETTLTDDATNGEHRVIHTELSGTQAIGAYAFSAKLTYINHRYVQFYISDNNTGSILVKVDLLNGVAVDSAITGLWTNFTYFVLPDGDGWRVGVSGRKGDTSFGATPRVNMLDDTLNAFYSGTGTSVGITDLQFEQSATPHDYVPSVTGPTTGQTRPAKQLRNRKNYVPDSTDPRSFINASAIEGIKDPFGGNKAFTLVDDSASGVHVYRPSSSVIADGDEAYATVYAAPVDFEWVYLQLMGSPFDKAFFNVRTGTIGTVQGALSNPTIERANNGYYRVGIGFVDDGSEFVVGVAPADNVPTYSGNDDETANFFGAMIELGTYPTPYIPTEGTAVTVTDDYGLFIPDWAVATDGGVSNGRDDGNVWDALPSIGGYEVTYWVDYGNTDLVSFAADNQNPPRNSFCLAPLTADAQFVINGNDRRDKLIHTAVEPGFSPYSVSADQAVGVSAGGITWATAGAGGLNIAAYSGDGTQSTESDDFTHITDTYNTSPMVDPGGAWANDSDSASIGFAWNLFEDFDEPDVRVFTDTFDRTDPAPWEAQQGNLSIVGQQLRQENTDGVTTNRVAAPIVTEVGKWYRARIDCTEFSFGNTVVQITTLKHAGAAVAGIQLNTPGTAELWWQATQTEYWWDLFMNTSSAPNYAQYDNAIIDEVPALDGWMRNVGNRGAIEVVDDALRLRSGGQVSARTSIGVPTTIGLNYIVSFDVLSSSTYTSTSQMQAATSAELGGGTDITSIIVTSSAGEYKASFTATTVETFIGFILTSGDFGDAAYNDYDNITVQESLLANPTFDTDMASWTDAGDVTSASINGRAQLTSVAGAGSTYQDFPTEIGKSYTVTCIARNDTTTSLRLRLPAPADKSADTSSTSDTRLQVRFTATSTSQRVQLQPLTAGICEFDWVLTEEALPDNSGQDNHAQVIGQIERIEFKCDSNEFGPLGLLGSFDSSFDSGFD